MGITIRTELLELVKKIGEALVRFAQFASERLRNDKDVVLKAVEKNGLALVRFASERLRNDKEFILKAV